MSRVFRLSGAIAALAASLLVACSKDETPTVAPTTSARKAAPLTEAQKAALKLTAQMVSAVNTDKGTPFATVKFELQTRPELNQPLKVKLVFIPLEQGKSLAATFVADRGLSIAPNQPAAQFDALEKGAAYPYELAVTPTLNGVHYFSAVVQLQGDSGEPRVQTYSVPVVVGPPPPAAR